MNLYPPTPVCCRNHLLFTQVWSHCTVCSKMLDSCDCTGEVIRGSEQFVGQILVLWSFLLEVKVELRLSGIISVECWRTCILATVVVAILRVSIHIFCFPPDSQIPKDICSIWRGLFPKAKVMICPHVSSLKLRNRSDLIWRYENKRRFYSASLFLRRTICFCHLSKLSVSVMIFLIPLLWLLILKVMKCLHEDCLPPFSSLHCPLGWIVIKSTSHWLATSRSWVPVGDFGATAHLFLLNRVVHEWVHWVWKGGGGFLFERECRKQICNFILIVLSGLHIEKLLASFLSCMPIGAVCCLLRRVAFGSF